MTRHYRIGYVFGTEGDLKDTNDLRWWHALNPQEREEFRLGYADGMADAAEARIAESLTAGRGMQARLDAAQAALPPRQVGLGEYETERAYRNEIFERHNDNGEVCRCAACLCPLPPIEHRALEALGNLMRQVPQP